jgi:ABC-type polysaccharide/polyol phosphate export permease
MAPEFLRSALALNPLSIFIEAMRGALLDAHAPSWSQLGLMAGWLALMLFSGLWYDALPSRSAKFNSVVGQLRYELI